MYGNFLKKKTEKKASKHATSGESKQSALLGGVRGKPAYRIKRGQAPEALKEGSTTDRGVAAGSN